jgi:hypothetical protein
VRADGSGLIGIPTVLNEGRSGRGWSDSQSSDLSFVRSARQGAGARRRARHDPTGRSAPLSLRGLLRGLVRQFSADLHRRPIFALMGTDLVEGSMESGRIGEVGRLDLTGEEGSSGKRQAL